MRVRPFRVGGVVCVIHGRAGGLGGRLSESYGIRGPMCRFGGVGYSPEVAFSASHSSIRTSGSSSERPRISSTRRIR